MTVIRQPWYARPVPARVTRRVARWLRRHTEPARVVVMQGGEERPAWALRAGARIAATDYDHAENKLTVTLEVPDPFPSLAFTTGNAGGFSEVRVTGIRRIDDPPMHHPV